MFVLFNVGQPMTGQRMFESDEEEDDWQVSAPMQIFLLVYCDQCMGSEHQTVVYWNEKM